MLILTRKRGTSVRIGRDVVIHVIQTGRNSVKLAIDAPDHVRIMRAELADFPAHDDLEMIHEDALLLQH